MKIKIKGEFCMKKIIFGVMAIGVVSTILTACSSTSKQQQNDTKELSYWCSIPPTSISQISNLSQMTMYQEMEKQTGIKIQFIHPAANQSGEQFNLMIASGEFPDMIEYDWRSYSGGPDQAVADNIIVPLNDLLQDHAPNFLKLLQNNEMYDAQSKTDAGTYYGFPSVNVDQYRCFGGLLLRKDWLDDLGLNVPETLDEWETVLRAFKEQKGATAPFTGNNDIFATSRTNVNVFNTAFGIGKGFYLDGQTVKYAVVQPEYKSFMDRMSKWYAEGLIDRNYDTNTTQLIDSKMINGESGARVGFVGSTIGTYLNVAANSDENYDLVAAPYVVMNKGDIPKFAEVQPEISSPMIAITTACKNVEMAVEWADYLYSEKGAMLKNFGVEGLTYQMVDSKPVYTDEILHNPEGLSIAEAMGKHFRATSPSPGINQMDEYLEQYYQLDQQNEACATWTQYIDQAKETALPPLTFTAEENAELSNIMLDINTYVSEMQIKFVKGDEPIDNFDAFVENLENMRINDAVAIYQTAADRYFNRN